MQNLSLMYTHYLLSQLYMLDYDSVILYEYLLIY